ncbi:hypothetical protein APSETT444_009269 [Aspergillus pseudonomiae]
MSSMQDDIEDYLELVRLIPSEFKDEDIYAFVDTNPDAICQTTKIALWAQSISGEKKLSMRLPSLSAFLKRHAENGPGSFEEHYGIRYKFVKRSLNPESSTHMSTLS